MSTVATIFLTICAGFALLFAVAYGGLCLLFIVLARLRARAGRRRRLDELTEAMKRGEYP